MPNQSTSIEELRELIKEVIHRIPTLRRDVALDEIMNLIDSYVGVQDSLGQPDYTEQERVAFNRGVVWTTEYLVNEGRLAHHD